MSPRTTARLAGLFYLAVIVTAMFAQIFVLGKLVVAGDAAATAHNILAHEGLYRQGLAAELATVVCNVPLALLLFETFKVVNRRLALLAVLFQLISVTTETVVLCGYFTPLVLLHGGASFASFTPEQLQALVFAALHLFEYGYAISLVFCGFDCITTGYLIFCSGFLPRILGVLLAIEGGGYLFNSVALILAPDLQARIFPYFTATGIAEIAFCLWLVTTGLNVPRWHLRAAAAPGL